MFFRHATSEMISSRANSSFFLNCGWAMSFMPPPLAIYLWDCTVLSIGVRCDSVIPTADFCLCKNQMSLSKFDNLDVFLDSAYELAGVKNKFIFVAPPSSVGLIPRALQPATALAPHQQTSAFSNTLYVSFDDTLQASHDHFNFPSQTNFPNTSCSLSLSLLTPSDPRALLTSETASFHLIRPSASPS